MKVRDISWFRTNTPSLYVLHMSNMVRWDQFSFLNAFRYIHTREEFEKHYLEWKSKNEG